MWFLADVQPGVDGDKHFMFPIEIISREPSEFFYKRLGRAWKRFMRQLKKAGQEVDFVDTEGPVWDNG